MLNDNAVKEHLAYAYIYAVATRARCSFDRPMVDRDSVDVKLAYRNDDDTVATVRSPEIAVQVKGHALDQVPNERVPFALSRKNHLDLTKRAMTPRLLVVVLLPTDASRWLELSEEQLVLRCCGYWLNLSGSVPTANETTETVYLPRAQVFDPRTLERFMRQAGRLEALR